MIISQSYHAQKLIYLFIFLRNLISKRIYETEMSVSFFLENRKEKKLNDKKEKNINYKRKKQLKKEKH